MRLSSRTPALPSTLVRDFVYYDVSAPLIIYAGTSLIALPTDMAEMINAQIGATKGWNGQYTVDCAKVPDLPDLTFYFDSKPYVLKGTDYILEVQGTCISSFTGLDMPNGLNLWIVGKC